MPFRVNWDAATPEEMELVTNLSFLLSRSQS